MGQVEQVVLPGLGVDDDRQTTGGHPGGRRGAAGQLVAAHHLLAHPAAELGIDVGHPLRWGMQVVGEAEAAAGVSGWDGSVVGAREQARSEGDAGHDSGRDQQGAAALERAPAPAAAPGVGADSDGRGAGSLALEQVAQGVLGAHEGSSTSSALPWRRCK